MNEDKLTKIVIDLPGHWGSGGEGIWAKELGNDPYQISGLQRCVK
jgi:hypothetical protein